ncbi:hypothetical protein OPQ81_009192 [Rhizoctonia solani]|nr:hypothetical protein OPQ81_009192 [Rhizoctonia solani]
MKDLILDANFPRTPSGRVYHLGLKYGEIANRIVTVGDPKRARTIAASLDVSPKPFELLSERGFLTITGRYHGVPVSVVAIGMGGPNMDFFVREARECLTGDMIIVRYGSCGALTDIPVGSLVIPDACVAITRNWDFDFDGDEDPEKDKYAYIISKPVSGDRELHAKLIEVVNQAPAVEGDQTLVLGDVVNAAADSFYSSQGRQTSFPDHNSTLIERALSEVPRLTTLEMETFHLYHLAKSYTQSKSLGSGLTQGSAPRCGVIRASGIQMVFASRPTQEFITPDAVQQLERWVGRACLEALTQFGIAQELLHPDEGIGNRLPIFIVECPMLYHIATTSCGYGRSSCVRALNVMSIMSQLQHPEIMSTDAGLGQPAAKLGASYRKVQKRGSRPLPLSGHCRSYGSTTTQTCGPGADCPLVASIRSARILTKLLRHEDKSCANHAAGLELQGVESPEAPEFRSNQGEL